MKDLSKEELFERIKGLPEDLRDAFFSAEIAETLMAIGKKHNILLDKIGDLGAETYDIILGISHPSDFVANIEKELGVSRDVATQIAQEVNTLVFSKIRESLKKLHNIKDEEAHETMPEGASRLSPAPSQAPSSFAAPKTGIPPQTQQPLKPPPTAQQQPEGKITPAHQPSPSIPFAKLPVGGEQFIGKTQVQESKKEEAAFKTAPQIKPEEQKMPSRAIPAEQKKPSIPKETAIPKTEVPTEVPKAPFQKTSLQEEIKEILPNHTAEQILPQKEKVYTPSASTPTASKPSSPFEERMKDEVFRQTQSQVFMKEPPQKPQGPEISSPIREVQTAQEQRRYPEGKDPYRMQIDPKDLRRG